MKYKIIVCLMAFTAMLVACNAKPETTNHTDTPEPAIQADTPEPAQPKQVKQAPENRVFNFGDYNISLRQRMVTTGKPGDWPPNGGCQASLTITDKNGSVIKKQEYIKYKIHPVGSWSGLFVPDKPPHPDYFAVTKEGDYNGRLFLFSKSGQWFDMGGGRYFVSADGRFLFSEFSSDAPGVAVFDFEKGDVGYTTTEQFELPYIKEWRTLNGEYFFLGTDDGTAEGKVSGFYWYDAENSRFIKKPFSEETLKSVPVAYDFGPTEEQDCGNTLPKETRNEIEERQRIPSLGDRFLPARE